MYVLCVLSSASELFTVHIIKFIHFAFSVKQKHELVYLNLKFSKNEFLLPRKFFKWSIFTCCNKKAILFAAVVH